MHPDILDLILHGTHHDEHEQVDLGDVVLPRKVVRGLAKEDAGTGILRNGWPCSPTRSRRRPWWTAS